MTGFQRLTITTCVATFLLIIVGAVVRTTDSGLGCPDWPLCHGEVIPPFEKAVLIEYSHRLVASVVGFLVAGVALVAWLRYRRDRLLVGLSTAALVLVIFQAGLGGATVLNELPAEIVTAHLATALVLFAVLLTIATLLLQHREREALQEPAGAARGGGAEAAARFQPWAIGGGIAVYALLLTGSYVVGANASLVTLDWPLVDNRILVGMGDGITNHLLRVQWLHRASALAVGVVVVVVAVQAHRLEAPREMRRLAWLAVALYFVQIFVGAGNIWTRLSVVVASAHLALAAAIWGVFVVMTVLNRITVVRGSTAESQSALGGPPRLTRMPEGHN